MNVLNTTWFRLISGSLNLQPLEAGLWFPGQRLKSGHGSEHWVPATDHQARLRLVCFLEINFNKKKKSSETSKQVVRQEFLRKKKVSVNRQIEVG